MKQLKFFAAIFLSLVIMSCNKDDDQATGVGDVMIIAKQSGTNTVYGISINAYTFSAFSSVNAVSTADPVKSYALSSYQGYKTSFYYETPDNQLSTSKPAANTFNFTAVFENGVTQEFQDVLTGIALPVPTFEECEYSATDHQLNMEWMLIDDADSYAINIFDGSNLVYASTLNNTVDSYPISSTSSGWLTGPPTSGKSYTVRLYARLYEPDGGGYDIQAISVVEKTIVWGN